jgi:hypothetical protein
VRVRPLELGQHARELVTTGTANVGPYGSQVHVEASERIDVRLAEGNTQRPARLTVGELVQGCVDDIQAPSCLAQQAGNDLTLLRRERHLDRGKLETAIGFGLIGGAIGACMAECQGDADLDKGLAYSGGAFLAFAAAFLLVAAVGGD